MKLASNAAQIMLYARPTMQTIQEHWESNKINATKQPLAVKYLLALAK